MARVVDRLVGRIRVLLCIDGVSIVAFVVGIVCRCSFRRGGRVDIGDCA